MLMVFLLRGGVPVGGLPAVNALILKRFPVLFCLSGNCKTIVFYRWNQMLFWVSAATLNILMEHHECNGFLLN